jgi:hypothetical protein
MLTKLLADLPPPAAVVDLRQSNGDAEFVIAMESVIYGDLASWQPENLRRIV